MRLLIVTQAVDLDDLYLSFFHSWLEEFSKHFDSVQVVCLKEGRHALPQNVTVYSLGKESGASRLKYLYRFFRHLWTLRGSYDAALVHMNQEYVLLGGLLWRLSGVPVYMWRNHYSGNLLTDIAALLCRNVFCTSRFSYTAKYDNTVFMPVGVDTSVYSPMAGVERRAQSILFYGRLSPSKHPDVFLEALGILKERGVEFRAEIRGSALPQYVGYERSLHERADELGIADRVTFLPGRPFSEGPSIFSASEIYVNLAGSGMYDKMIFEAAACGCLVIAASRDYAALVGDDSLIFPEADVGALADRLERALKMTPTERGEQARRLRELTEERHSLSALTRVLEKLMTR